MPFGSQQEWCKGQRFGVGNKSKPLNNGDVRAGSSPWSLRLCYTAMATTARDPRNQLPTPSNLQVVKGLNLAMEPPDLHSSETGLAQEGVGERLQELQVQLMASMPV